MNRTITTTSTTRRRRSLRHAALALCAVLVALVAASCTADALDGTDTGAPSGNGNPDADVLTFAVSPRPGFTEVATTRGTNTKAVIPVLNQVQDDTRNLPNGKAGFSVQEIAGQARNDRERAGNSAVIPGTKAVIPGNSTVIPGLTRDLPNRSAALIEQEIAGQARNDSGSTPATRAVQTPGATQWQTGDILWLDVLFVRDKQNAAATTDTAYNSALKYDANEWRYLTVAETEDLNTRNIPNFSRLVRWPRRSADWVAPGIYILAYYAGSGKPDADGILTINPEGEIPATPFITGRSEICSPDGNPVPLELSYENTSRVRIPAGCKVELTDTKYMAALKFPSFGIEYPSGQITEIPEQSEDTDVFLWLSSYSTAKLTRDNVSHTFTFPDVTDADGNLTNEGASYTFPLYTSGTETPGGYDLTIADEDDLRAFAQAVNAGDRLPNGKPAAEAKVLQTANIELTQEWVPIGNGYYNPFRGAYNGNGHEISGLSITKATQPDAYNDSHAGLFGRAEGAVLTGIKLRGVEINIPQDGGADYLYVGSIAGYIKNSTLSLCAADGAVNTDGNEEYVFAGGIAGYNYYSTISRCRANVETKAATTNGRTYAGGIAGQNEAYSFILSCEVQGKAVTAEGGYVITAGGIAGLNDGLIAFCRTGTNTVTAQNGTGSNLAGGLVGQNDRFLYSCYSRATATATGTGSNQAGAIVGNKSPVPEREQHCYATGAADPDNSNLDPNPVLGIVYDTNPDPGEIFGVMTNYTGEVKSLDNGIGRFYYPFTTRYDPAATPAYGIIPLRTVWTSDGAWNMGDGTYPALNIEEYEGRE